MPDICDCGDISCRSDEPFPHGAECGCCQCSEALNCLKCGDPDCIHYDCEPHLIEDQTIREYWVSFEKERDRVQAQPT